MFNFHIEVHLSKNLSYQLRDEPTYAAVVVTVTDISRV